MAGNPKNFPTTPALSALYAPFVVPPPLCDRGAVIGLDRATGRVATLDMRRLKILGIIEAMEAWFAGLRGRGKSAEMKILVSRMGGRQHGIDQNGEPITPSVRANDSKPLLKKDSSSGEYVYVGGEYGPFMDKNRGRIENMQEAAGINLFDDRFLRDEIDFLDMAHELVLHFWGREPEGKEVYAIQVAVRIMLERHRSASGAGTMEWILHNMTTQDVDDYLEGLNNSKIAELEEKGLLNASQLAEMRFQTQDASSESVDLTGFSEDEVSQLQLAEARKSERVERRHRFALNVLEAAENLSSIFAALERSHYGRTFGSETSVMDLMAGQYVSINWHGMRPEVSGLLQGSITKFTLMQVGRGDFSFSPTYEIADETASELKGSPVKAKHFEERLAKGRSVPTISFFSILSFLALNELGEKDSALRGHGQAIARSIPMRWYGLQPYNDDVLHEMVMAGMTDTEAAMTTNPAIMTPGTWVVAIKGQPSRVIQTFRFPSEISMTETGQAEAKLNDSVPNDDLPPLARPRDIKHLAKTDGVHRLGLD